MEALGDCVRRIELRRLSAAKQASTATLAERTAQEDMSAAVEEARAVWQSRQPEAVDGAGSMESDAGASELAVAIVEDMEKGRTLHQAPADGQPSQSAVESTRSEDGP